MLFRSCRPPHKAVPSPPPPALPAARPPHRPGSPARRIWSRQAEPSAGRARVRPKVGPAMPPHSARPSRAPSRRGWARSRRSPGGEAERECAPQPRAAPRGTDWWAGGFCFPSSSFPKGRPPRAGAQPARMCPADPRAKGTAELEKALGCQTSGWRMAARRVWASGGCLGESGGQGPGGGRQASWAAPFWGSKRSSHLEAEALQFGWVVPPSNWGLVTP